MSLINAVNMGDHALISADTEAVFADGSRGQVSKLLTIPHLNAVIACRGSLAFLQKAHAEFCTMSNFDQMAERAELVMSYALAQQGSTEHLDKYAHGAEMVLAGYSQKAGRVVIHLIRCEGIGKDTEAHLDIANAILPGNLGISLEGITASREGLIDLTSRQVKAIREHAPDAAAGGNLIVAEVHQGRVAVETVAAFAG